MTPAFCPQCGAGIEEGDDFCTSCGSKILSETDPPPPAKTDSSDTPPAAPAPASAVPVPVAVTVAVVIVLLAAAGSALYTGALKLPTGAKKVAGKSTLASKDRERAGAVGAKTVETTEPTAPASTTLPPSTTTPTTSGAVDAARRKSYNRLITAYRGMPDYDSRIAKMADVFNADISDGAASDSTCTDASSLMGDLDGEVEELASGNPKVYPDHIDDQKRIFKLYEYLGTRIGAISDACYASRDGRSYSEYLQNGRAARLKYQKYYPQWEPKL